MIGTELSPNEVFRQARENAGRQFMMTTGDGTSAAERLNDVMGGLIHKPKFKLDRSAPVFTIGSCFARNIETALEGHKIACITSECLFDGDFYETGGVARNGALNAYTPGSMLDLIQLPDRHDTETVATLDVGEDQHADMLLHGLRFQSADELTMNRRKLVGLYKRMPEAGTVVLTLGYTESWLDIHGNIYINRAPAGNMKLNRRAEDNYRFVNMSPVQVSDTVSKAVDLINHKTGGGAKIIITVSPVPLASTFTGRDVIVANDYSKATLLSAALLAAENHENVDYFPSFQYVTHQPREQAYEADGIHVKYPIVQSIIGRFVEQYF